MIRINVKELKWFLILVGFTYYIFYLISTKKLYLFIHPRMTIYMDFSLFILIILSLLQVKKIFKVEGSHVKRASTIFLLPLLLVYIVNPQGLNGIIISQKGYSTDSYAVTTTASKSEESVTSASQGNLIKLTEKNYYDIVNNIKYNTNKYKWKKITIGGFIYKDETFPKDTFVVGRLIIICCAADAELTGIVFQMNNSTLQNDQWVEVTGIIDVIPNFDKDDPVNKTIPVIKVTSVNPIAKPSNPYIYMKGSGRSLGPA
ncbi:TIGR03943 family putative permease subunit [Clostridium akagii]|uniref:TIGR03943 family putative permease subunit n=1 Tax=Clostridium akagii TaxID=91623 RepID=UPI00047B909B|nr:TIGR03943 family protein [Clostridium akagii]